MSLWLVILKGKILVGGSIQACELCDPVMSYGAPFTNMV